MRGVFLRAFLFVVVALTIVAGQTARTSAQQRVDPRSGLVVVPEVLTKLETALASTNTLIVADYHHVDLRFGPNVRIDAVIVSVGGAAARVRGLRVQVPDESRGGKPDSTSYVDIDEIAGLTEALASMSELVKNEDHRPGVISFTSTGGLRIEVRTVGRVQRAFLSTGLVDPVSMGFDTGDLVTLKQALEQGLALLAPS